MCNVFKVYEINAVHHRFLPSLQVVQDIKSFEEATKENEERIRLQVLQKYVTQLRSSSNNIQILQASKVDNLNCST
jgi:hypothetical protein